MWQWVAKSFLQKIARERLAEAVSQTAKQAASTGEAYESEGTPESDRRHVGVVMALAAEAGGLLDRMSGVVKNHGQNFVAYSGSLANRSLVVALSGPGATAAERTTAALIDGHKPDWILSAGFAGGLDQNFARGDLIVPNRFVGHSSTGELDSLTIDAHLRPSTHLHVGTLLTVDRLITSPDEKRSLGKKYNAQAVDMESLAVARLCQKAKKRFLAVRVITDTATDHLPDDLDHLLRQSTLAGRAGAVTGSLFRHPSRAKDLMKLKTTALECSETLAKFLSEIVDELD